MTPKMGSWVEHWSSLCHAGKCYVVFGVTHATDEKLLTPQYRLKYAAIKLIVDSASDNVVEGIVQTLNGEKPSPWRRDF